MMMMVSVPFVLIAAAGAFVACDGSKTDDRVLFMFSLVFWDGRGVVFLGGDASDFPNSSVAFSCWMLLSVIQHRTFLSLFIIVAAGALS